LFALFLLFDQRVHLGQRVFTKRYLDGGDGVADSATDSDGSPDIDPHFDPGSGDRDRFNGGGANDGGTAERDAPARHANAYAASASPTALSAFTDAHAGSVGAPLTPFRAFPASYRDRGAGCDGDAYAHAQPHTHADGCVAV